MKKDAGYLWIIMLILVFSGLQQQLTAQIDDFVAGAAPGIPVPGYVILNNGDTLFGKIRWALKYVENNPVEIKYIAENGDSKFYNAGEVRGFGNRLVEWADNDPRPIYSGFQDYVTLPSYKQGTPVFMMRLLDGRLTVYLHRGSPEIVTSKVETNTRIDGIGFNWIPGEGLSIGPTYRTDYRIIESRTRYTSCYVSKENGAIIKVNKNNYEEVFSSLFGDCPEIGQELNKNPDLNKFKNFMILAEVYNRLCPEM